MSAKKHGHGLADDLRRWQASLSRRQVLGLFGAAALVPIVGVGCDDGSVNAGGDGGGGDLGGSVDRDGGVGECTPIPQETGGPYPADGTNQNGLSALTLAGIVRSDIRTSIGNASGTAAGVPLSITLQLVDTNDNCAPLSGYAVYLWHCNRDGDYSMYTGSASSENYLRGVQVAGDDGTVTFQSIFPACYSGRWPHIHFEIFSSVAQATSGSKAVRTTQLALPKAACDAVFATTGYEQSVDNLAQTSLTTDMVFSDGSSTQVATVMGSVANGYAATLTVGVAG